MRRPSRSLLLLVVLAVVLVAACGGDGDRGYDTADDVLRAAGLDPAAPGADAGLPEGCTRTVTTDEYGFETEVLDCPDEVLEAEGADADLAVLVSRDDDLPIGVLGDLVAEMAPSSTRDALGALLPALERVEDDCGVDRTAWRDAVAGATGRVRAVEAALADGVPNDLDGTETTAIGRAVVERLVLQSGCRHPGVGAGVPEDQLAGDGTLDATVEAATAAQDLDQALTGSEERALFYLYSQIQYAWMRPEPTPLGVAVVGTSQAGDATDVAGLTDALGTRVGNAFLPGGSSDVIARWLEDVTRLVDPEAVVWYVGALDLLLDCDGTAKEDNYRRRHARLERAFAPPGWFRTVDPLRLVLGPVGEPSSVRGDVPKQERPDPEAIAAQTESYRAPAADASYCEGRAAVIGDAVDGLRAEDRAVYVVGMPTSPRFVDLVDGGMPTVQEAFDRLVAEELTGEGIVAIDLLGQSQDDLDQWRDLTHMTSAGATAFSDALADAMLDEGFEP